MLITLNIECMCINFHELSLILFYSYFDNYEKLVVFHIILFAKTRNLFIC